MVEYNRVIELLNKNNQPEIINYLNKLNNGSKDNLANQVLSINFNQLNDLYKKAITEPEILDKKIEHLKFVDKNNMADNQKTLYDNIGEDIIKNNQYAVVTMAGGQGTRLGHNGPKGTYKLFVEPEPKYLFQILTENLIRANQKYNVSIPWYIMTSTDNNKETVAFFEKHNYFGYNKKDIKFFVQGNLPLLFQNGKLVMDKDCSIKVASDGNGCIYKSMKREGVLDDIKKRGVKWVFVGSVDNALADMVDPTLIGLTISDKNEIASKSVAKRSPSEKVGVFCKMNNQPSIIEYTELPEELSVQRDSNGELLYGEANIICHLYSVDALNKLSDKNLDYHVASKKSDYLNENGEFIKVTEPNVYKFESFIFDGFKFFDDISILRVNREDCFAPVKNKEGNDSPETAVKLYNDYWKKH